MAKKKMTHYGEYAFLAGVILALLLGILSPTLPDEIRPVVIAVLMLLGIIVGLVNVTVKEAQSFLIATIALLLAATAWTPLITMLNLVGDIGTTVAIWVGGFVTHLVAFLSPAAFIVALKMVYLLAKD
jgi:hypothetical protein